jgi:hypothetical protein
MDILKTNHLGNATRKGESLLPLLIILLSGFISGDNMNIERIREDFSYKDDGVLIWEKSIQKSVIGKEAGRLRPDGYKRFEYKGKGIYTHRMIFAYHHGYFPKVVDHINRDRSDNRIENLREADNCINSRNSKLRGNNKSGKTGVCYRKNRGSWSVTIRSEGKQITLGTFRDIDDAIKCRREAELKYYGEYTPA